MKCIYFGLKHKHFSNRIHLRIVNYKDIKLKPINCLVFFLYKLLGKYQPIHKSRQYICGIKT